MRARRPRPSQWTAVIAIKERIDRRVLRARLTQHRFRLTRTGSDDMMELLAKIPVERARHVLYGVGEKTVAALKERGFNSVADLWDQNDDEPRVPKLPGMGEARHWTLVSWVADEAERCAAQARANAARRAELLASIAELEAELLPREETSCTADENDAIDDLEVGPSVTDDHVQ